MVRPARFVFDGITTSASVRLLANSVIATVSQADTLATRFNEIYQQTLPHVDALCGIPADTPAAEAHHAALREALAYMESCITEMTDLLYRVDVFMAPSAVPHMHSFNPQAALSHVSDIFSGYQSELLAKREALADYTCEEISILDFANRWHRVDELEKSRKQEMDDLADMLAGF